MKRLIEIALEAGKILEDGYRKQKNVSYKGSIDLVTEYDVGVEKFLKKELAPLYTDYVIVGEESSTGTEMPERAIYIDPIDGTTNFVHGFPFCAVSIGFYNKGEAVKGIVYNPVINEMFTAEKGSGAFLNNERIKVSGNNELQKSLVATGFPYTIANGCFYETLPVLGKVLSKTRGIRRAGSAALDLCYTAKGVFDCYYEWNLKPWDVAAGVCILSEAGGIVTDIKGEKHIVTDNFIIGSNGFVHSEMLNLINS
jgi:myo-inositol-1(or 4)-monophosphatase